MYNGMSNQSIYFKLSMFYMYRTYLRSMYVEYETVERFKYLMKDS
jgi:hypothetical protein